MKLGLEHPGWATFEQIHAPDYQREREQADWRDGFTGELEEVEDWGFGWEEDERSA